MRLKKAVVSVVVLGTLAFNVSAVWGKTYYVQPGDSLYSIAARHGTTVSSLQQANGLSSSTLYPGQALYISSGNSQSSSGSSYTVRPGDSLYLISQRFGVSIDSIKRTNNLSSNYLTAGQRLTIPSGSSGTGSGSGTQYWVKSGDSLYLIAKKFGVTVEALKQANNLTGQALLAGQSLKIPAASSGNVSEASRYTVRSGDTLYLIAQRYGITVDSLRQANNLGYSAPLYPGQVLNIPKSGPANPGSGSYKLSQSDIDLLARLVSAESSGEPFNGQVAVASTILNRLRDPRYPNTIPGIVYQVDNGRYQYSPVLDGRINVPPTASAYRAVEQALSGWDPSNGANGFYNPDKTTNQWVRSHPVTAVIGDHVFFVY